MGVKRYDCECPHTEEYIPRQHMIACDDGDYVEYSDYAELAAQLSNAKFKIEQMQGLLKEMQRMINP